MLSKIGIVFSIVLAIFWIQKKPYFFDKPRSRTQTQTVSPTSTTSTTDERYEKAFANLIKEEGGYVNDPIDKGGETKFGISKRSYPHLDIKNLTKEEAKVIYKRDFYLPLQCDKFASDEVAIEVLEQGVNMGKRTVGCFVQITAQAMGQNILYDCDIGPQTIKAINKLDGKQVLSALKALAISRYRRIVEDNPLQIRFLKGWIRRVQE